jgi:serine protease Do
MAKEEPKTTELGQLGLTLAPGTGPNKDGVLITDVDSASNAAQKGLKSGDVILEVGNVTVKTPDEVANAVKEVAKLGRTAVLMRVKSGDQIRLVPVQLKKS